MCLLLPACRREQVQEPHQAALGYASLSLHPSSVTSPAHSQWNGRNQQGSRKPWLSLTPGFLLDLSPWPRPESCLRKRSLFPPSHTAVTSQRTRCQLTKNQRLPQPVALSTVDAKPGAQPEHGRAWQNAQHGARDLFTSQTTQGRPCPGGIGKRMLKSFTFLCG